jgi:hypothetical protein
MGIEDDDLAEVIIESAEDETDWEECPCCEAAEWLRAIAAYPKGACWVIYCGGCGKTVQKRWTIAP